ncbi:hypothetical protein [Streptomyces platensis]
MRSDVPAAGARLVPRAPTARRVREYLSAQLEEELEEAVGV